MQPTIEQQITTTGNIPGVVTPMGVSQKDIAHIMSVLTEQYSDPAMAALREIAANARDAHIRAGKADVPIRVSLPNRLNTDLVIEDEGIGMSVEFMEKRFSQYGDSDKRDEKFDIGGFGIGGKSPLAYTDSYTLVTVKDHEEATFVISRDKSGAASINRVMVRATDAGNGTKVKIPAVNVYDFNEKAAFLFKFWPEGSVLVDGEPPVVHSGKPISEGIWYSENANQSYLVMGGLPYRIASPQRYVPNGYLQRFHYIAEVGINDADITPSREDLKYTPKTLATLKTVGEKFEANFVKMVAEQIEGAASAPEAWDMYYQWTQQIGARFTNDMKYKGMTFTDRDRVETHALRWKRNAYRYSTNNNHINALTVQEARAGLFITGRKDTSSYTKSRVRLWMDEKGKHSSVVYFVDKVPTSPWVREFQHATWDDIKSVKPPRSNSSTAGTFEFIDSGYWATITREELAELDNIKFITPKAARIMSNVYYMWNALNSLGGDVTIIKLPENRWSKFRKDFPGSESFEDWAKSFARLKAAEIPALAWELKSLGGNSKYFIKMLNREEIDDPELQKLIDPVRNNKDEQMIAQINNFCAYANVHVDFGDRVTSDWFSENYPLTDAMYPHSVKRDDLVIYLNAAYAARKDN